MYTIPIILALVLYFANVCINGCFLSVKFLMFIGGVEYNVIR